MLIRVYLYLRKSSFGDSLESAFFSASAQAGALFIIFKYPAGLYGRKEKDEKNIIGIMLDYTVD